MAINGKVIQECMGKVVKLSMQYSLICVKTHPYVSCTVIFLLLLYLCFPWLFWSIIFLSLTASVAKIYFSFSNDGKTAAGREAENAGPKPPAARKLVRNDVNARSVRRRRPKEPIRDESSQAKEEEKNTVFSSIIDNVTVDKSALIEEDAKEIREVQVDSITVNRDRSALNSLRGLRMKKFEYGKGDRESEGSDSTEEDEGEKEENNKAVQWNEDDQKNLMDLGLSEIERNQRLESLIARRRARKLLSLQVRRSLMNMDRSEPYARINPIAIPRSNPYLPVNQSSGQHSPMPGSAPSVFRPMNPFDLPYDPQEEKPNLTGGSFHQEFLPPVLQKDMFCRHESFSLGSFFPGEMNLDDQEASLFDADAIKQRRFGRHGSSNLEHRSDPEDTDKVIEVESSQPHLEIAKDYIHNHHVQSPKQAHKEQDSEEIQTNLMSPDDSSCCSSSSSSEPEGPFSRIDKAAILGSLGSPLQRNFSMNRESRSEMDSDQSTGSAMSSLDKNKMEDRFFFTHKGGIRHKPTFSIASDLQVEVSEISSSPPLTIDGSISPHDEEVPLCEDENESRLRDIHEVRENNAIESGFPDKKSSEYQKMDDKTIEEGSNLHSQSIPVFELPDECQDQTTAPELTSRSTEEPTAERSQNCEYDKIEERSHSLENFHPESHTTDDANYSRILQDLNGKNLIFDEKDPGSDLLIREGGRPQPQTEWSMASSPISIGYPESQNEMTDENRGMFQHYQPAGENPENYDAELAEDFREGSMMLPRQESIHDDEYEQQETDNNNSNVFPQVHGSFQASQLLPQSIVQQLFNASVSSSPRSVLQRKFSIDLRSSSNLSEDLQADIQQFNRQSSEINVPDEPKVESFIYDEPRNTTLSFEDSQGYSDHTNTSTNEARTTEISSEQETELNRELLMSHESTEDLLKMEEKECGSRFLEEKNERPEQLHEQELEPGGKIETWGSNKKTEDLAVADAGGLEKQQQLPKLDDENKPFEAAAEMDTAVEVKELHPAEDIGPDNHIPSGETQEELAKPAGRPVEEEKRHSE